MKPVLTQKILRKHTVSYYYCEVSGLLKTEAPYWLDEAYQEAINDMDTGLVSRNVGNSNALDLILKILGLQDGTLLDLAGGYGMLTRLLRDKGYDCHTTDKYCTNLFAKTFEPSDDFQADALFAFEVLEHIENPLEFLSAAFETYGCKTLIFSTLIFKGDQAPAKDWWYYSLEGGQHITFYQARTLALLAQKLGCHYYNIDANMHVITDIPVSGFGKLVLGNKRLRKRFGPRATRQRKGLSKKWEDFEKMKLRLQAKD